MAHIQACLSYQCCNCIAQSDSVSCIIHEQGSELYWRGLAGRSGPGVYRGGSNEDDNDDDDDDEGLD